jgi:hypothetical protein
MKDLPLFPVVYAAIAILILLHPASMSQRFPGWILAAVAEFSRVQALRIAPLAQCAIWIPEYYWAYIAFWLYTTLWLLCTLGLLFWSLFFFTGTPSFSL